MTDQVLAGHEGPVSCLCFSPVQSVLASCSWDRTVRLWDMLDSWQAKETLPLTSDGKYRSFMWLFVVFVYSPDTPAVFLHLLVPQAWR